MRSARPADHDRVSAEIRSERNAFPRLCVAEVLHQTLSAKDAKLERGPGKCPCQLKRLRLCSAENLKCM